MSLAESSYIKERYLPYSVERMFDLVADVERYPAFLPGWKRARIQISRDNELIVDQEIGLGGLRLRFSSHAILNRPKHIAITATKGPFRHFTIQWKFTSTGSCTCTAQLQLSYEMRSKMLQAALGTLMGEMAQSVIAAFERRAHTLYRSGR